MAKKYQFKVKLVKAKLTGTGRGIIQLSDMLPGNEMRVEPFEGTLSQAIEFMKQVSASEPRQHAAFLSMADKNARAPNGFNGVKEIYGGNPS